MRHRRQIDGAFVEPTNAAFFDVIKPATKALFVTAAAGTAVYIDLAVRAARRAFGTGQWPRLKASERGAVLRRSAALIRDRLDEIAALEARDNGKPLPETRWDVGDATFCFDH